MIWAHLQAFYFVPIRVQAFNLNSGTYTGPVTWNWIGCRSLLIIRVPVPIYYALGNPNLIRFHSKLFFHRWLHMPFNASFFDFLFLRKNWICFDNYNCNIFLLIFMLNRQIQPIIWNQWIWNTLGYFKITKYWSILLIKSLKLFFIPLKLKHHGYNFIPWSPFFFLSLFLSDRKFSLWLENIWVCFIYNLFLRPSIISKFIPFSCKLESDITISINNSFFSLAFMIIG